MATFVYVTEYTDCDERSSVEGVYANEALALASIQKLAAENIADAYEGDGVIAVTDTNPDSGRPVVKLVAEDGDMIEQWTIWQTPLEGAAEQMDDTDK